MLLDSLLPAVWRPSLVRLTHSIDKLGGEVELLEVGAGALEVGEFHLGIFAGEDDAVGIAVEGGEDGVADVRANPMVQRGEPGAPRFAVWLRAMIVRRNNS
jgi:hypothetical protein